MSARFGFKSSLLSAAAGLALLGPAPGALAEPKEVSATIPWEGEGRVFRIGPTTLLFLGALKGIIYVEHTSGDVDEGFVECPVTQRLELKTKEIFGWGNCMITPSGGDTIFAEWTCAGVTGRCRGEFRLTGGTGKFEGITGSSEFLVRSPLRALATDMSSGTVLRVASGLAVLPKLTYEVPAK
jgi:hypothetical protein